MTKFSITKELKTNREIQDIREKILKDIPENILFSKSREELCSYVLNKFDFPDGTINLNDFESLKQGCKTIMKLMGIEDDEQTLLLLTKEKFDNILDRFLYYILDFSGLPGIYKEQFQSSVESDLDTINNFITEYKEIEFIKREEKPRNHDERTKKDYYERCLNVKKEIEKYLNTGINKRALSQARRSNFSWGIVIEMMFDEYDKPYILPKYKSNEYFDYRKIDKVGHRIGKIPIRKSGQLKQLYDEDNKEEFYSELEKLIPEKNVLEAILQGICFLPFIQEERKEIFKELVDLYENKKWFGFYALGLIQIEGLFTEMCKILDKEPHAALPDKVNTIRPYHLYSENRFDYFQYYLPNLRNSFLHGGLNKEEKIEILCKELLWDLKEVVSIFLGLDIKVLHLLRLIRKKDEAEFMSISGLCYYLELIASVKRTKQYGYFEAEVKKLNETYLPNIVNRIVSDLDNKINSLIETIYEPAKRESALNGFEVDLKTISSEDFFANKEKVKTSLKETFNSKFQSEIEELLQISAFINSYHKHLDIKFIATEVKDQIKSIKTKYDKILKIVMIIYRS